MSYQQGYPQQQSGGMYPAAGARGGGNPAMAIIAAVLGLVAVAALVVLNVNDLKDLEGSIGDLPGEVITILAVRALAALLLLVGVLLVFVRKVAGAILIAIGGLVGAAIIVLFPVIVSANSPVSLGIGEYLKEVFKFSQTHGTFSAITLIASPLALILAIIPPTLKYLRGSAGSDGYDDYSQPGGGYPQTPASGYPQTPSSGYPQTPGSGYPQQGYPQQPQQPGW
jgi:hypothetical protein